MALKKYPATTLAKYQASWSTGFPVASNRVRTGFGMIHRFFEQLPPHFDYHPEQAKERIIKPLGG
jgi:hypothetical protein